MSKPRSPINTRTAWHPVLRPIGRLLIAAQLALVLQPLSVLAQDKGQAPFNPQAQTQLQRLGQLNQSIEQAKARKAKELQSPADRVSDQLARAHELTAQLASSLPTATAANAQRRPRPGLSPTQRAQRQSELSAMLAEVVAGTASVQAEFEATRAELHRKGLPAQILARHDEAKAQIDQRANQLTQIAARTVSDDDKVRALDAFFKQYPAKKRHTPMDPGQLPWGAPKATPRMPAETKTAWYQQLTRDHKVQLAQAAGLTTIGGIQFTHPPEPTQAPQDADLAETPDVQLTPAIRAQAQQLGYNPVAIENWVRNNIQWLPTWGSIQGADGTLKTLRGNAFDTASLTIALLRASGIPARYQFGTIEVPADAAMNWVGGVQKPEAALNLMYQGGIAARGLVSAGRIAAIRMEHVWVRAYTNFTPSRGGMQGGAAHRPPVLAAHGQPQHPSPNAQLNLWAPLDGAFKQYDYAPGLDLKTAVPVDANALLTAVQQGATVTPNYVQNLNQANLQAQLTGYQNQLKAYIDSSPKGASATVGDVLGTQTIRKLTFDMLTGALPYVRVVTGNQMAELPDSLRWKVSFHGFDLSAGGGQGTTLLHKTFNLTELLGRRVGITYEGAAPADQQAIANYRISGATSFPAYVLRVRPLFQLDGNTVAMGESTGMGKDVQWRVNIIAAGQTEVSGNQQTYGAAAGDETVWAVVADAVSAAQLQGMSFPATAAGNLHAVGMSYWHQVDAYAKLMARREGAVVQRMPSLGAISSGLRVNFVWGVPTAAHYLGRTMDIGHSTVGVQGMDGAAFQRELGMRTSYLEGNIFDQVFNRETGTGLSAARLIEAAQESGQRVFTLTSGNADPYLGLVQMSAAIREEVIDALTMGLQVTIPEFTQDVNGWQGTAYIAIQPETGAGAYIISGGMRGGDEGGDCQTQPATDPAKTTDFGPAVLFAAAIIALLLIATIGPVVGAAGVSMLVVSQSAVGAPVPQLPPRLDTIWNRLSGGRPWPTQFNWPPANMPNAGPPGTCTVEQHAALEAAKDIACNDPLSLGACKGNMKCEVLREKGAAVERCITARLVVMDTCFQGGDADHWLPIQEKLGQINNCNKCLSIREAQECRRPPE